MRVAVSLLLPSLAALTLAAGCSSAGPDAAGASEDDLTQAAELFADRSSLALTLEAPFDAMFDAAHAGEPSGPLPGLPRRTTDEHAGTVSFAAKDGRVTKLAVTVKVRGSSSLFECRFPKLTVKLTDEAKKQAAGTPFAKTPKLKIGTHCGDEADDARGTVGRLRNEKSPLREQLVLAELEALLPVTLASRPAQITYVDATTHVETQRHAFLLEHPERLALRSGAPKDLCRDVDGEEECDPVLTDTELAKVDPRAGMDRARIAMLTLFHAAVGNWDWHLDVGDRSEQRVWNHDVLMLPALVPVAHDFDLASAVTGRIGNAPATKATITKQLKTYLARTDGLTPEEIATAKALFVAKRAALEATIAASGVDAAGKANAQAHLDAFFAAIAP